MNLLKLSACLCMVATTLFSVTGAAEEAANPLKIGGKLWVQFSDDMTTYPTSMTTVPKMAFDIYRAYFIADYKFNDDWKAYLVYEATRNIGAASPTGGSGLFAFVKDMYIQNNGLLGGASFRVGIMPTPYASTIDSITKVRWLTTNLNDSAAGNVLLGGQRTLGFTPSHDAGFLIFGKVLDGMIDYNFMVHNGIEFTTVNGLGVGADTGVGALATFTIKPFGNSEGVLKGLGFTISDDYFTPARSTTAVAVSEGANLIEAAVHYTSSMFDGVFEFGQQTENYIPGISGTGITTDPSSGFGVTGNFKVGDWSLFAKYQTGTTQFQNNKLNAAYVLTAGPTYTFVKDKVMTAIVYETRAVSPVNNISNGGSSVSTNTIFWKWAANF